MKKTFSIAFFVLLLSLSVSYAENREHLSKEIGFLALSANESSSSESGSGGSSLTNDIVEYAGRLSGIIGVFFLGILVLIGGGARFFDKKWGLPVVIFYHKILAVITLFIILIHPVTLFILKYFNAGSFSDIAVLLGPIAFFVLVLVVISSLLRKKFPYSLWIIIHRFSILALAAGVYHSFALASWVKEYVVLSALVVAGAVLGVVGIILRILSMLLYPTAKSRIIQVEMNSPGVYNVVVEKPQGFQFTAGQFCIISFNKPGLKNPHPFTISSSPDEKHLVFTIKSMGKFTSQIHTLTPQDKVKIRGPFGVFTYRGNPSTLIAGGVGITPFRSILGDLKEKECPPVTLLYGSRTEMNIIFHNWFSQNVPLQVVHILSQEEKQGFLFGNIDEEYLKTPAERGDDFYVCGPPAMVKSIKKILGKLGVRRKRIYSEKFFY